jgi:hypothetical protein
MTKTTSRERKDLGCITGIWLGFVMPIGFGLIWGWKIGLGFFIISQFILLVAKILTEEYKKKQND